MSRFARCAAAALVALSFACRGGPARPAALDTRNDACSSCRMPVSNAKLAAQLAAPGEEPRFFDDIGCLRDFLAKAGPHARRLRRLRGRPPHGTRGRRPLAPSSAGAPPSKPPWART